MAIAAGVIGDPKDLAGITDVDRAAEGGRRTRLNSLEDLQDSLTDWATVTDTEVPNDEGELRSPGDNATRILGSCKECFPRHKMSERSLFGGAWGAKGKRGSQRAEKAAYFGCRASGISRQRLPVDHGR